MGREDDAKQEEEAFAAENIDQILAGRTEKRQIGNRKGNTFSTATFSSNEVTTRYMPLSVSRGQSAYFIMLSCGDAVRTDHSGILSSLMVLECCAILHACSVSMLCDTLASSSGGETTTLTSMYFASIPFARSIRRFWKKASIFKSH